MLKDNLMTKKDLYKIYEEKFNELWYNGAKEKTFDWIKKNLTSDGGLICCIPYNLLYVDKSKNTCYTNSISLTYTTITNTQKDINYDLCYENKYYFFYFLKSKLWNEGINLLIDEYGNFYMSIRYDEDKYNDMFIIRGELKYINNIDLISVAQFAKMPVGKVYDKFVELDAKRNQSSTDSNIKTSKSNSKNKKRNHKKPITIVNNTVNTEILHGHDIKNFDNDGDEIIKTLRQNNDEEKEVLKEF